MPDRISASPVNIGRLIFIPACITLGVTFLRLTGELAGWTPVLFNRNPGGGGAPVGISWLPLIFGPYFAVKLVRAGHEPRRPLRAAGLPLIGLALLIAAGRIGFEPPYSTGKMVVGYVLLTVSAILAGVAWQQLGKTMLVYAYAARIPVAIVMFLAIKGQWGTHYDVVPHDYPGPTDVVGKFIYIGLLPQLILWVAFTVVIGTLSGAIAAALTKRRAAPVSSEPPPIRP